MKILAIILFIFGFEICCAQSISTNNDEIDLYISSEKDTYKSNDTVNISIHFINESNEYLRLLDYFIPYNVFFTISIKDENNHEYNKHSGGKISFQNNDFKYIDIEPKSKFKKKIDISNYINKDPLKSGKYFIQISYHNQYGKDCIKGWFDSNIIIINIK